MTNNKKSEFWKD